MSRAQRGHNISAQAFRPHDIHAHSEVVEGASIFKIQLINLLRKSSIRTGVNSTDIRNLWSIFIQGA